MRKHKIYPYVRFTAEVFIEAISRLRRIADQSQQKLSYQDLQIDHDDATWNHDTEEEFLADYRKYNSTAHIFLQGGPLTLSVWAWPKRTEISVKAASRSDIETVFAVFEAAQNSCKLEIPVAAPERPVIFVGHGRSTQWRDLKDHLHEKHGYKVEAYETGARAGHTIRDILEEMITKSSFAALVLTAEDEQFDGEYRARQNVVHEAGLFQGRLGFPRAIMLLEEGVQEFSNVQGVQYIRFSRQNIKETFGEVLATLRREFER